jgi:hypothetical protein
VKRPARISVIGKVHTVHYVPAGDPMLRDHPDDPEPGVGRHDRNRLLIAIEEGQALANEQDTLLHEVLHAVETAMGLDVDEEVVEKFATGLLSVLKDNPGFVTYLRTKKRPNENPPA